MLLSCRCTSQITPEGNYQAINPDIRRMDAAYLGADRKRWIYTAFFHRRHYVSPRWGPVLTELRRIPTRWRPCATSNQSDVKQTTRCNSGTRCTPTALAKRMICDVINCMSNKWSSHARLYDSINLRRATSCRTSPWCSISAQTFSSPRPWPSVVVLDVGLSLQTGLETTF